MGLETIFVLVLGLSIGSFLNVVIQRLPRNISIIQNRSRCENCRKNIKWHDLIPILSYLLLRGKCRYCLSPISVQYPVVEFITAVLFIAVFYKLGVRNYELGIMSIAQLLFYWYIISSLIVIFFIDLKHGIIPDKLVYPPILLSFLFTLQNSYFIILNHALSAIGAFLFFLALFLITRGRGMGFGDVKLAFLMGILLGFPHIVLALYIAFLTGALVSIILVLGRTLTIKNTIPFGPFLVIGTVVSMLYGDRIILIVYNLL